MKIALNLKGKWFVVVRMVVGEISRFASSLVNKLELKKQPKL